MSDTCTSCTLDLGNVDLPTAPTDDIESERATIRSTEKITLQVGERLFHTTVGSLVKRSEYFEAFFSGRWPVNKQDNDSIFIDTDPGAFEHVLNYLRRGVFPLAFDRQRGHDYSLYAKIFEEAKYFQCPLLIVWLEDECYYKCVTWQVSTEIQETAMPETGGDSSFNDCLLTSCSKNDEKIYICPRSIDIHRGNPQKCGRQCRNAQGDDGPEYETKKVISGWLVTRSRYQFNRGWMTDFAYVQLLTLFNELFIDALFRDSFINHLRNKHL